MRVSLAAQTMSHSVAAGMSVMVQFSDQISFAYSTFYRKNGYAF